MTSPARRPAALIITRNLPPLVGGMERLVWHIVNELRPAYRVHVIGPEGCRSRLPEGVSATEVPLKPMYLYLLITKLTALWHSLRRHPEIVFAGSGLTAPFAWLAARLTGARCVVYLHGLDVEAHHPIYRLFWRPFFRHCDRVLVNSQFTYELARDARVPADRLRVLNPGVGLPDQRNRTELGIAFRERHGLGKSPVMLYVGRITPRKGLAVFARHILPTVMARHADAKLVVIGDEPLKALQKTDGERGQIEKYLTDHNLAGSVLFLGECAHDDPDLDAAYFAANVLVFPVQQRPRDNEGFGMVAIEAAAHGLPTVAFAAAGVVDAVADGISGRLIPVDDTCAFANAVLDIVEDTDPTARRAACRHFSEQFSWSMFGAALRSSCRINPAEQADTR